MTRSSTRSSRRHSLETESYIGSDKKKDEGKCFFFCFIVVMMVLLINYGRSVDDTFHSMVRSDCEIMDMQVGDYNCTTGRKLRKKEGTCFKIHLNVTVTPFDDKYDYKIQDDFYDMTEHCDRDDYDCVTEWEGTTNFDCWYDPEKNSVDIEHGESGGFYYLVAVALMVMFCFCCNGNGKNRI